MSAPAEFEPLSPISKAYNTIVLGVPLLTVVVVLGVVGYFGTYLKNFKIDASSDSIVLENDDALRYYSYTRDVFGSDDYIFLTVIPDGDLLADDTLEGLQRFTEDLIAIDGVDSVTSILTVPLFHSPKVSLFEVATGYKTLAGDADRELARTELVESPLYRDLLVNEDATATNLQVNFEVTSPKQSNFYNERSRLRDLRDDGTATAEDLAELEHVEGEYERLRYESMVKRRATIADIRAAIHDHEALGTMYHGGVPMIMADIIRYVEDDMIVFGIGVVIFIMVMLLLIFREVRWVILPAATSVMTVLVMVGYLGMQEWWLTIVTSNFTSLLLIVTLAMSIHIVVRYREIYAGNPLKPKRELMLEAVRHVAVPCLFMALTTMVGFGSLIVSDIRPVMDFGLMMAIGIPVAYVMCFVFLPAAFLLFPTGKVPDAKFAQLSGRSPMSIFARIAEKRPKLVAIGAVVLAVFCAVGASRLQVENRFIDYFKKSSEIYQGMTMIDEKIGGTTPLEVVIKGEGENYWMEPENLAKLRLVHEWLDDLPETGKVLSPDTLVRMLEGINAPNPVSKPILMMAIRSIPADLSNEVIRPYLSPDFTEARISMRVRESSHDLNRKELLARINTYFESDEFPFEADSVKMTGMFVLYNNLLQSLWSSQFSTIGLVFGAIFVMFAVLFRSIRFAIIAIIPNILPVILVLGTLGWMGVPLDLMTIMIAAITLGIAVDDTVHYIHRFRAEFPKDRNYIKTMYRCHNSIGRAISYTTITIVAGFSVLMLSHFIPNIYFGFFTGIAMIVALLACVMLLPLLIITIKPLGPESQVIAVEQAEAA